MILRVGLWVLLFLLVTGLDAFYGPQPDDIYVGDFPNKTNLESHSASKKPVVDLNSSSKNQTIINKNAENNEDVNTFIFLKRILEMGKKAVHKLAESTAGNTTYDGAKKIEISQIPVLHNTQQEEPNIDVKPTKNTHLLDRIKNLTINLGDQGITKEKLQEHHNSNLHLFAESDPVKLPKTNIVLKGHEISDATNVKSEDDCDVENTHNNSSSPVASDSFSKQCKYGIVCPAFLILASSLYFHHTLHIG